MSRAIRSLRPIPGAATVDAHARAAPSAVPPAAAPSSADAAASVIQPATGPTSATSASSAAISAVAASSSTSSSCPSDSTSSSSFVAVPASVPADPRDGIIELKSPSSLLLEMFEQPGYSVQAQLRCLHIQLSNAAVTLDLNLRGRRRRDLLMHIVALHSWSEIRHPTDSRLVFGDRAKVQRLLQFVDFYDVNAVDDVRNGVLHHASSLALPGVADPSSFICQLVAKLIACGCDVNARGEHERTPLNPLGSTNGYSAATSLLPLLLAHGGDPTIADDNGSNCVWTLVRQQQWRLIEIITTSAADDSGGRTLAAAATQVASASAAAPSPSSAPAPRSLWLTAPALRFEIFRRNDLGESSVELAARLYRSSPGSRDARATDELMQKLARTWRKGGRSQLQALIAEHVPVADLSNLITCYLDGSGRPFMVHAGIAVAPEQEDDEDGDCAAATTVASLSP